MFRFPVCLFLVVWYSVSAAVSGTELGPVSNWTLAELLTKFGALEQRMGSLERTIETQAKEIERLTQNKNYNNFDGNSRAGRSGVRSVDGVAFTAVLSQNVRDIGIGQVIKFDNVLLNDRNGFDEFSGTFIAPEGGVYLFTYTFAHIYQIGQVWLQIMVNGVQQNGAVSDAFHDNQEVQGGNVAIIRINPGDRVWIECFRHSDGALYGRYGLTSFSGVLLY